MTNITVRDRRVMHALWMAVLAAAVFVPGLFADGIPKVTGIEPAVAKVSDSAIVSGEYLGKGTVTAVLLSDEQKDFEAVLVAQADGKITIKIPQVKPGDYNVSIQVGNSIMIQPIRLKVQE